MEPLPDQEEGESYYAYLQRCKDTRKLERWMIEHPYAIKEHLDATRKMTIEIERLRAAGAFEKCSPETKRLVIRRFTELSKILNLLKEQLETVK